MVRRFFVLSAATLLLQNECIFVGALLPSSLSVVRSSFFPSSSSPKTLMTWPYSNRSELSSLASFRLASSTAIFAEKSSNPFRSVLGNVASSFSSLAGVNQDMATVSQSEMSNLHALTNDAIIANDIGAWDKIRSTLESKQTSDEERNFRKNLVKGYGIASPLHKLRLFHEGNREEDVRVTLFRDSASWCPYCQKVWMTLEQKRIPYRIEKINMNCYGDKPPKFLVLQPNGNIPVAIIDGITYRQSNDIIYALEEKFPDSERLMPFRDEPSSNMKAQELLRLERQLFSAWMYWLTSRDSPDGRLRQNFISALQDVEGELRKSSGDFFMGKSVSVVDIMYAPFLERMCASLLYFKSFQIRVPPKGKTIFPAINKWFDIMETLESYQLTKSDYYTHCWDLPPQLGGCVPEPGSELYQKSVNGDEPGSWQLPLSPHNGGIEPEWAWAGGISGDDGAAKREAVERVSANSEAIVAFAARGAGTKGFPRYGAPLADPKASSNVSIQPCIDAVLRIICLKLLGVNISRCERAIREMSISWKKGGEEVTEKVVLSLAYLRDRVGVPRDMRLPAARQLRAHLNWAIEEITKAG